MITQRKRKAQTHDLSERYWGHSYEVLRVEDSGRELELAGWCHGIEKGDYLILQGNRGVGTTRYRVTKIAYQMDPKDMWFASVRFAPREGGA